MQKKKKKKTRTPKSLNKKLWTALSAEMRIEKPYCEYCGHKENLQVHHVISKYYAKSLFRFDRANLIVLCPRCHMSEFHKNPVVTMQWFQIMREKDFLYLLKKLQEYNLKNKRRNITKNLE